jgi:hypothetical protein
MVERAYDRSKHASARTELLNSWSEFLSGST